MAPLQIYAQGAHTASPGGVSTDLNYWLKPDTGVTTFEEIVGSDTITRVSNWANQSPGSTNELSGVANSARPVFIDNGLNFNSAISFDGVDDFLRTDNGWDNHTVIIVFNPSDELSTSTAPQAVLVYDITNNDLVDAGVGIGNLGAVSNMYAECSTSFFWNSGDRNTPGTGFPPEFIGCSGDADNNPTSDPVLGVLRPTSALSMPEHRLWGADQSTIVINPQEYGIHSNRPFTIGQRHGGGIFYNGDVLEAISYSSRVHDSDIRKIESYLAIKYGLTLDQEVPKDYINSIGVSIYNADPNYSFNIAGIGRDDDSALNQKQSLSTTSDAVQSINAGVVTIGLGEIADSNADNLNTFSRDGSFLVWGNNGAATDIVIPTNIVHNDGPAIQRMSRIWKVQLMGQEEEIEISIDQTFFSDIPVLLVSDTPDFSGASTVYALTDDGEGNYSANINGFPGRYFTFGQQIEAIDCTTSIVLDQTFISGEQLSFAVSQTATLSSEHLSGSYFSIRAGDQVSLDPGFSVLPGAEFKAFIDGCE